MKADTTTQPGMLLEDTGLPALRAVPAPRATRILARVLIVMVLVAVVALVLLPWLQNIGGRGRVTAFKPQERMQVLHAPVAGRIMPTTIVEGDPVKAGQVILTIVDNDPTILERLKLQQQAIQDKIDRAADKARWYDSQVEQLEELLRLRVGVAEEQLKIAVAKLRSEEQGVLGAKAALEQVEANYDRQLKLFEDKLASKLDVEREQRAFKEAEAKYESARQAVVAAERDVEAKRQDIERNRREVQSSIESARANREAARGDVASAEKEIQEITVKLNQQSTQQVVAPRDGRVFRLHVQPGSEFVKSGDPLLTFIPDSDQLAVELWVDGNDAPLIKKGNPVRLQFEGWPAVQFAGWPSVAVGTFGGYVEVVDQQADSSGKVRILVLPSKEEPWPEPRFLRQGIRANGWVLLDWVPLWWEIWRVWNGFPPTVTPPQGDKLVGKGGK